MIYLGLKRKGLIEYPETYVVRVQYHLLAGSPLMIKGHCSHLNSLIPGPRPRSPEAQEASSEPQSQSMGAILMRKDSHLHTWGGSPQNSSN